MASFIDLDSTWRDRTMFPNENKYELTPKQVVSWTKKARTVRAFPEDPALRPLEFVTTINLKYLTLPYTDLLSTIPRIYINFSSREYKDTRLINTIDGRLPESKFICQFDKVQSDSLGNPIWIHYKCEMEQTMRFKRDDTIILELTSRDGNTLPQNDNPPDQDPNPDVQTLLTFEVTPYIRDGDYDNHMAATLNI